MGNDNNSKTLWTFLAGAAAGGLLGVLFAPDKGSVTREKINKQLTDLRDKLKDAVSNAGKTESNTTAAAEDPEEKRKSEELLAEIEKLMKELKNKKS